LSGFILHVVLLTALFFPPFKFRSTLLYYANREVKMRSLRQNIYTSIWI